MTATNYVKVHYREPDRIDEFGIQQPGRLVQSCVTFDHRDHQAVHIAVQWAERESKRIAELGRDARIAVWNRLAQRPQWPQVGQRKEWN